MDRKIPFLKYRPLALTLSAILFAVFLAGTVKNSGFTLGVDFAGGSKLTVAFEKGVDESSIRSTLSVYNPIVQRIGSGERNEFIISTSLQDEGEDSPGIVYELREILSAEYENVEFLSVENVGPAIGAYLTKSALKLILIAVILMSLYLAFRFEVKYAVGAVAALLHDLGLVILFIGFAGVEINIPVVAALLTVFGYSVNDTIVIFDRIRENVNLESKTTLPDLVNMSINQSIVRTLITSLTTLIAVVSLYILGGEGINEFALVLIVGIAVGTYSSIYIASPVLLWWEKVKLYKR